MSTTSDSVNKSGQRLAKSASKGDWSGVEEASSEMLWSLAEIRPDFIELPSWIAANANRESNYEPLLSATKTLQNCHSILRNVCDRYGNDNDRAVFANSESALIKAGGQIPVDEYAEYLARTSNGMSELCGGNRRLSLAVAEREILIGRHTRISFNRTLRIPEDGREYPLPAWLGRLPILRVEDYAKRVPDQWLEQGGFIIPLYQREALFLEFTGVQWRPTIGKVSVGCVNAISGKEYDLKIHPHRQDYIVIPEQRWLDGINTGSGSVSQFVAMPLGKGYTIEAQVTDEEKHGGFQLAVFDPKSGRFREQDPRENEAAIAARKQRGIDAARQMILGQLPAKNMRVIRALQKEHCQTAAKTLGMTENEILEIIEDARCKVDGSLGPNSFFDSVIPLAHILPRKASAGAMFMPNTMAFSPDESYLSASGRPVSKPVVEMGIARGGKIKQQIMEDTYGAESWDPSNYREVILHIVNSAVYKKITGLDAPPTPITPEHYQNAGLRWYSDYNEKAPSISPVAAFKRVLSIGRIDKERGTVENPPLLKREIQPEEILRIRTPSLEDQWKALLDRAVQSSKCGRHRIAAREASLALDLSDKHPLPFFIRALANHRLGLDSDAEADASSCLKLQSDHLGALSIRAYSCLALGEPLLAKNDAEAILTSEPDDYDGLYVRAEANLKLAQYKQAAGDAEEILRRNPANRKVLRIRKAAMTKLFEEKQVATLGDPGLQTSVSLPKEPGRYKTLDQQLIEIDDHVIGNPAITPAPFWNAVREEVERALTGQSLSVLFFQHYTTFFYEASLLEMPLNKSWDAECLALVFESAFNLGVAHPIRAKALMNDAASKRGFAQQMVAIFNRSELGWPAHNYVRQVVDISKELMDSRQGIKWLLASAENFFWAGIYAATEARKEPEAMELIEFFDISNMRRWGDSRFHINLLRTTPLHSRSSMEELFDHPLLHIADEKYRNSPTERKIIYNFLKGLCTNEKLKSERDVPDRDLFICQWVREGIHFGERLLQNDPDVFEQMFQTPSGYTGTALVGFYKRRLSKVKNWTNPLDVTKAFLDWQVEERGEVSLTGYYGERLETVLNCIDAAIFLPWAEAAKGKL